MTPTKTNTSQLVAYVGSGYNSHRSDYMALTLENGKFTATYKTSSGKEKVSNAEPIVSGQTYNVGLLRTGKQVCFKMPVLNNSIKFRLK